MSYVREHLWNVGWASLPFVTAAFDAPGDVWAARRVDRRRPHEPRGQPRQPHPGSHVPRDVRARLRRAAPFSPSRPAPARARSRRTLAPMFGASLAALGAARRRGPGAPSVRRAARRRVRRRAARGGRPARGPASAAAARAHPRRRHSRRAGTSYRTTPRRRCPLLDLMGATHDRLYARLFQS